MRFAIALTLLSAVSLTLAAPIPKEVVKLKPATDKERDEVKTRLKLIGLGIMNYESAFGYLPGDSVDPKTKKPLLSWRVQILPFLEEDDLYRKFNLQEPWDSKTNKPLIDQLPKIFAPTRVKSKAGETFYRGFGGKGEFAGVFQPGVRVTIVGITDGCSNTIGVIDAGEPVIWTKPDTDIPNDPKKPLSKLGGMIDGDFYCTMCDGSFKTIRRNFEEKVMRAVISRSGGEVVEDKGVFADR